MGMSMGNNGSSGGRRRRGRSSKGVMSEINVTPLVDVMLVLLIIFMVTAPMMTVGVPIDMPETKASQLNSDNDPLVLSIDRQGQVFLMGSETPIAIEEIVPKLLAIAKTGYKERIFIKGDKSADYGTVMKVMALISSSGFSNMALQNVPENN